MSEHEQTSGIGERDEAGVPERLRRDLSDVFSSESGVPGSVDRAIERAVGERFGRRRQALPWRWGGLAAAAGLVLVGGIVLWSLTRATTGPDEQNSLQARRGVGDADLNRDGNVDVLDALILAKAVDAGDSVLDLTGDGATSAADVEALARRIVTLRRRG